VKITYQQMIAIFAVVIMIFLILNIYYPQVGTMVTFGVLVPIFIIYKVYQYTKKDEE